MFMNDMDFLRQRLLEPLPGLSVQTEMAPKGRITADYDPNPLGARLSAVLLIVLPDGKLVFIRRAANGRRHSGQIAFPGGLREEDDEDLISTALRETREEIGVTIHRRDILGVLSPLYIPVSNTSVLPVVARMQRKPRFIPEVREVEEVLMLPIDGFDAARDKMELTRNGQSTEAPCFRFGEVVVWGATAMMTAEFLKIWSEVRQLPGEGV
jgi:8-oxo-dGTP pyrophosphatase MutT (NUDIX family)